MSSGVSAHPVEPEHVLDHAVRAALLGPHANLAEQRLEHLAWQAVQKNDLASIQQFLSKYPNTSYSDEATRLLSTLQEQQRAALENNDWIATDKNDS